MIAQYRPQPIDWAEAAPPPMPHVWELVRPWVRGPLLDAGCGSGWLVTQAISEGLKAEGVDVIPPAVPGCYFGSVEHIPCFNETYGTVVSLGVIEHEQGGPLPALREFRRVLRPAGRLIVSVPHWNLMRRLRGEELSLGEFYQWLFTWSEFAGLLRRAGFTPIHRDGYGAGRVMRSVGLGAARKSGLLQRLGRTPWARRHVGHMILVVAERSDG